MTDNVSKIKDRLDIVEVVGSYVKLQKAGINYKGRCPFHNEKTPSFFVTPERQIWHCFGCAKGGDMFEFVKEIEGVEFPEAMKILAARAGIELEAFRPEQSAARDAKTRLFEICELATKFFEKQFQSSTGKLAFQYLLDRGVTLETIKEFRLGFAPNDWEGLSAYLKICGYSETEIVDAGMAVKREAIGSGIYDRFRCRIMFPIADISGQAVGFTGRAFDNVAPTPQAVGAPRPGFYQPPGVDKSQSFGAKYVNSPQTLIYDKSRVLYGLYKAKLDIKKADQCILVEGNMDALMSYQAGVRNVVASSGTALTPHHLRLLQRYTKNLGFCFDTDQAGAMATKRGIGLALGQQFNIRVLEISDKDCKDPADYVQKYGPKWSEVVASAKPVVDYYFDKVRVTYNPTSAESKRTVIAALAPFLKRLTSSVERAHWIGQLASLLRVPESAVSSDINAAKDELAVYAEPVLAKDVSVSQSTSTVLPDMLNEAVLSVVLKDPVSLKQELAQIPHELLDPQTAGIIQAIAQHDEPFLFSEFVANYSDNQAMHLEFANLRSQELWKEFEADELKSELNVLVNALHRRSISARLTNLQFDLKEAESAADKERIITLAGEFSRLANELSSLHKYEEKNQKAS